MAEKRLIRLIKESRPFNKQSILKRIKKLKVLTSYWFLIGLILLLFNDFLFKEVYGNWFTGKLSDFTGLFVFSLLWTALWPQHKNKIFVLSGLLFIFWKSPYSQTLINIWNDLRIINISRIVDYTDLWALTVLPVAFYIYKQKDKIRILKINPIIPLTVSFFMFAATSYQKDYDYNSTYNFSFSKEELVQKINALRNDSVNNLPLSLNLNNANDFIVGYSDTLWYFTSGFNTINDTIWRYKNTIKPNKDNLYQTKKTNEIDTIYYIKNPIRDTMYVSKVGRFIYQIPVEKYMKESKTGYCSTLKTKVRIDGNQTSSSLTLLTIYTSNCMGMFERDAKTNEKDNLLKAFEIEFIEKIKNTP